MNSHDSSLSADVDAAFDWAGIESAFTMELESFARFCLGSAPRNDDFSSGTPEGTELAKPLPETEDGLLFADLDFSLVAIAKSAADPVGITRAATSSGCT